MSRPRFAAINLVNTGYFKSFSNYLTQSIDEIYPDCIIGAKAGVRKSGICPTISSYSIVFTTIAFLFSLCWFCSYGSYSTFIFQFHIESWSEWNSIPRQFAYCAHSLTIESSMGQWGVWAKTSNWKNQNFLIKKSFYKTPAY